MLETSGKHVAPFISLMPELLVVVVVIVEVVRSTVEPVTVVFGTILVADLEIAAVVMIVFEEFGRVLVTADLDVGALVIFVVVGALLVTFVTFVWALLTLKWK